MAACADASAPAPPTPSSAALVFELETSEPEVALTFETGRDAGGVAGILAILRRENVRASFAVTGLWAEAHPALLNAIAADGHTIINGTYSGRSFTGVSTGTPALTRDERLLELQRTETTVYRLTNRSTRPLFFPPWGDVDDSVLLDARAAGYAAALVPALRLDDDGRPPEEIGGGAIVGLGTGEGDAATLRVLLGELNERELAVVALAP